jgi:tripartite-type tricarboxylate transporter receptor subunit TctC
MIGKRPFGIAMAALCLGLGAADPALAQSYPNKAIRIILPGGPGGTTDILARVTAHHLQAAIGQNVIIENVTGGGGVIAAKAAVRAVADGHTLLFGNTTLLAVIPAISKSPGYDPGRDFAPVAKVGDTFQVLVSEPSGELGSGLARLRQGQSGPAQLFVRRLRHPASSRRRIAEVDRRYRRCSHPIQERRRGGQRDPGHNVAVALPLIQEGKLRALAVTSAPRARDLPNVPTMSESGVTGYVVTSFFGVVGPAETPPDVIARLNSAINQGLRSPDVQASLAKLGVRPAGATPTEFEESVAAETQKWSAVVRAAGFKMD